MESVKVVVRFRAGETGDNEDFAPWEIQPNRVCYTGRDPFTYDAVLGVNNSQLDLYEASSRDIVSSYMDGYNATIFAYGQSGSGKTFSMLGPEEVTEMLINRYNDVPIEIQEKYGIIPRCTDQIFSLISAGSKLGSTYSMQVSYIEIYNESVNDLLSNPPARNLKIREFPGQGMQVIGATGDYISTPDEVFYCIAIGTANRITCATKQNERSSRSHTVMIISIEQTLVDGSKKVSKLNLVDLAGSEKISKTQAKGQALKEAQKINLSLTTLGRCIKALTSTKDTHVPFRESKLTRILRESLGGNAKTVLICTASRKEAHLSETTGTLKFAARAKLVKTNAQSNIKRSVEELTVIVEQLKNEIRRLKKASQGEESSDYSKIDPELEFKYHELQVQHEIFQQRTQNQIAELEFELERSQEQIDTSDYSQIQQEIDGYIQKTQELQNQLSDIKVLREEKIKLEKNLQQVNNQVKTLKTQVETYQKEKKTVQAKLLEARQSVMIQEEAVFLEQSLKEAALQDLSEAREKIKILEEQLNIHQRPLSPSLDLNQNEDVQILNSEIHRLKIEKNILECSLEQFREKKEESDKEYRYQITHLKKKLVHYDNKHKQEIELLQQTNSAIKLELESFQKSEKAKDEQIEQLKDEQSKLINEVIDIQVRFNQLEQDIKQQSKEQEISRRNSLAVQQINRIRTRTSITYNPESTKMPILSVPTDFKLRKTNTSLFSKSQEESKSDSASTEQVPYTFELIKALYSQDELRKPIKNCEVFSSDEFSSSNSDSDY